MKKIIILFVALIILVLILIIISKKMGENMAFPSSEQQVESEVEKAIKSGDHRFLGVMGIGLVVPGVENFYKEYSKSNGVNIIPGTSDAFHDENQKKYQDKAQQYALMYNKILLEKLEKLKKVHP